MDLFESSFQISPPTPAPPGMGNNACSVLFSILKDCLLYLFHGFRHKYFNKISLDNLLYFQNKLYKF